MKPTSNRKRRRVIPVWVRERRRKASTERRADQNRSKAPNPGLKSDLESITYPAAFQHKSCRPIWNYERPSLSLRIKRGSSFSLKSSRFRDGILILLKMPCKTGLRGLSEWEKKKKKSNRILSLLLLWVTQHCPYLFSNIWMVSWWSFHNQKPAIHLPRAPFLPQFRSDLSGFSFRHSPCHPLPEVFLLQT